VSALTTYSLQSSRKSGRSGRLERRRRRINERLTKNAPELLQFPPMAKALPTMALLLATSREVDRSNCHLSATNLALRFLASTRPQPAVFNNCRSTATIISRTPATRLRLTALQTRCIANVITPSYPPLSRAMLTSCVDNGGPAPKYEH
jgi:hypothetical protein